MNNFNFSEINFSNYVDAAATSSDRPTKRQTILSKKETGRLAACAISVLFRFLNSIDFKGANSSTRQRKVRAVRGCATSYRTRFHGREKGASSEAAAEWNGIEWNPKSAESVLEKPRRGITLVSRAGFQDRTLPSQTSLDAMPLAVLCSFQAEVLPPRFLSTERRGPRVVNPRDRTPPVPLLSRFFLPL